MEFGLLGPLVVRTSTGTVPVRPGKQRTLMAALLLAANRTVTLDELTEVLWGIAPPPSAGVAMRNYVRRLRRALGDGERDRLSTQSRGYLIRVEADELDVTRFESLVRSAQEAARGRSWDQAVAGARAALTLWRGEPLADIESEGMKLSETIARLDELRLQALETRIDAELNLGGHAEVIVELRRLTAAHPLRERLHAVLMLALYRCGRQGEALAAYQQARKVLVEEHGIEPTMELRRLQHQILTADPVLAAPEFEPAAAGTGEVTAHVAAASAGTAGSAEVVPRQLP